MVLEKELRPNKERGKNEAKEIKNLVQGEIFDLPAQGLSWIAQQIAG
jgi:hypothetical protein